MNADIGGALQEIKRIIDIVWQEEKPVGKTWYSKYPRKATYKNMGTGEACHWYLLSLKYWEGF